MNSLPVIVGVLAWVAYLLAMPGLWLYSAPLAAVAIVTVGGYLALGLGYYRHELYHTYYKPFTKPLYHLTSFLVFSDPQLFRIAHPAHHGSIHSVDDLEFFCSDYETNRGRRKRQFLFELLFGNAAWELMLIQRLKAEKKYNRPLGLVSFLCRVAIALTLGWVADRIWPGGMAACLVCFALTLWWGAIVSRHNQFIEHLGIVSSGTLEERNLLTRNLRNEGWMDRLWNLYTRNDPREHVLHHTKPGIHSRVRPEPLPAGAKTTTVREYPRILLEHYRSL